MWERYFHRIYKEETLLRRHLDQVTVRSMLLERGSLRDSL